MDKCKHCEQVGKGCPCTKVDSFFRDNWDLMYVWHSQAEYKFAYVYPKPSSVYKQWPESGAV